MTDQQDAQDRRHASASLNTTMIADIFNEIEALVPDMPGSTQTEVLDKLKVGWMAMDSMCLALDLSPRARTQKETPV